jgi:hypothetical protein
MALRSSVRMGFRSDALTGLCDHRSLREDTGNIASRARSGCQSFGLAAAISATRQTSLAPLRSDFETLRGLRSRAFEGRAAYVCFTPAPIKVDACDVPVVGIDA